MEFLPLEYTEGVSEDKTRKIFEYCAEHFTEPQSKVLQSPLASVRAMFRRYFQIN